MLSIVVSVFIFLLGCVACYSEEAKVPVNVVHNSKITKIVPCPKYPDIVAVYDEVEPKWNGQLYVYQGDNEGIQKQFSYPDTYEKFRGHYVVRFRWVVIKQIEKPVLEVIESTHMGNGSLRLWELDGQKLRLILETTARGQFWDLSANFRVPRNAEARFEGAHLDVRYWRPKGQDYDCVRLSGKIQITDLTGNALPTRQYEQICRWDPNTRTFVVEPATSP